VWDFLLSAPSSPRLAVVWDAEKLDSLDHLPLLLGDEFDCAFTVFVAAAEDFSYHVVPGPGKQPRKVLVPALAALRDSRHGQLVRCCAPKDPEGQAQLVASWWPGAGRNLGAAVLERCSGDLSAARQAVFKACFAGLDPLTASLDLVCPPEARDDFANQVVAGNVKRAMVAAAAVEPEQAGAVLGLLSSRLSILAVLGDAMRKNLNVQDTAIRLKIDPYVVKLLRPHAAAYTRGKVARCREVLALAESAWRSGARDGILEAVAALW
jgi:hypothetical protein